MSLSSCSIRSIPPCDCRRCGLGRTLLEYADGPTTVVRASHAETLAGARGCARCCPARDGRARRVVDRLYNRPIGCSLKKCRGSERRAADLARDMPRLRLRVGLRHDPRDAGLRGLLSGRHDRFVVSRNAHAPRRARRRRDRVRAAEARPCFPSAGSGLVRRAVLTLHDARDLAVDLVDRRLRACDEALALLPHLLVRVALAGVEPAEIGDQALGGLDLVREVARREVPVERRHLARPCLQRQALAVHCDQAPAENASEMDDRVGMHDADVALDAEVPQAGGKDGGDQHGRRGLVARLVTTQLRDEVRAPCLVILGIVDDATARRALVPDVVQDVGAELATADPLKGIVGERGAQLGLEISLGTVTELVRGLLLERPLQLLGPALQALVLAIRFRLHLEEGAVVVGLQELALLDQPLVLARREGSDLTLVLLAELAPRLGLARRDARALLLPDSLLDRFVFSP